MKTPRSPIVLIRVPKSRHPQGLATDPDDFVIDYTTREPSDVVDDAGQSQTDLPTRRRDNHELTQASLSQRNSRTADNSKWQPGEESIPKELRSFNSSGLAEAPNAGKRKCVQERMGRTVELHGSVEAAKRRKVHVDTMLGREPRRSGKGWIEVSDEDDEEEESDDEDTARVGRPQNHNAWNTSLRSPEQPPIFPNKLERTSTQGLNNTPSGISSKRALTNDDEEATWGENIMVAPKRTKIQSTARKQAQQDPDITNDASTSARHNAANVVSEKHRLLEVIKNLRKQLIDWRLTYNEIPAADQDEHAQVLVDLLGRHEKETWPIFDQVYSEIGASEMFALLLHNPLGGHAVLVDRLDKVTVKVRRVPESTTSIDIRIAQDVAYADLELAGVDSVAPFEAMRAKRAASKDIANGEKLLGSLELVSKSILGRLARHLDGLGDRLPQVTADDLLSDRSMEKMLEVFGWAFDEQLAIDLVSAITAQPYVALPRVKAALNNVKELLESAVVHEAKEDLQWEPIPALAAHALEGYGDGDLLPAALMEEWTEFMEQVERDIAA